MARRLPLEDKLIGATLLVLGIVMAGMTVALLLVIRSRFPEEAGNSLPSLLTLSILPIMAVCYTATLLALWLLVRWLVVRPTRKLLEATRQVADGRLDYRAEPLSTDELGELAESFNRMTARLQDSFQSIERLSKFNALILDSMSSGLIATDSDGHVQMANRTACSITGLNAAELDGARLTELDNLEPLTSVVMTALAEKQSIGREEVTLRCAQGSDIVLGVSVSLLDNDGGAVAVFADLTTYKRLETEARLRHEMAALGELTAGVVHEIRSPLSVISATAQLMLRRIPPDHEMRGTATSILDEVKELERTVTGLLMFARPIAFEFKETDLGEVINRAVTLCRPRLDETGVRLERDLPATLPRIHADRERLAQAFANLIQNSVDALDRGGTVRIAANRSGPNSVALLIADDGPGIAADVHDKLYEPFFSQKEGGTGLGLSIVHKVITAHDGRIELMPTPTGATFQVTLPVVTDMTAQASST